MTYSSIVKQNPNNCRTKHCRTSQQLPFYHIKISPQKVHQSGSMLFGGTQRGFNFDLGVRKYKRLRTHDRWRFSPIRLG
jgi:hypothetical protein